MFQKTRWLLYIAVLALLAAACNGGTDSVEGSGTSTTAPAAAEAEDATTSTSAEGDEADAEESTTTTEAAAAEDSEDSGSSEDEEPSETEGSGDEGSGDEGSGDEGSGGEDSGDAEPAEEESEAELLANFLTGGFGIDVGPDSPIVECMIGKGMTPADFLGGGDLSQEQVAIALFTCAPDEIAAAAVADDPMDVGTEEEQVCVIAAFYRTIGEIPEDQLGEFLAADSENAPEEVRDTSIDRAIADCGVSTEVATAIFDDAG